MIGVAPSARRSGTRRHETSNDFDHDLYVGTIDAAAGDGSAVVIPNFSSSDVGAQQHDAPALVFGIQ